MSGPGHCGNADGYSFGGRRYGSYMDTQELERWTDSLRCCAGSWVLEPGASPPLLRVPSATPACHHSSKHPPAPCPEPSPALPALTDALVHVGVAGIEVSRRAGRQADAHLANVVSFQQNEQLGRALEAAVDLGAELTTFGTGLAPLSTDCKGGTGVRRCRRDLHLSQAPTRVGRE